MASELALLSMLIKLLLLPGEVGDDVELYTYDEDDAVDACLPVYAIASLR